ncbi:MAG TPA: hypothetical protein VM680_14795 [Verrucomicrobiae bacterium]|nr:hypothetical protein [Verrucomicrobiae bacterium]
MKWFASLLLFLTVIGVPAVPEPQIGGVIRHGADYEISVIYTEPVDIGALSDPENYAISSGTKLGARLVATNQGAILLVSGLDDRADGSLSVSNMSDPGGNPLPAVTLPFEKPVLMWAEIGANELGFRSDVVGIPENGFDLFNGGIQQRSEYDEATFVGQEVPGNFDVKVRVDYVEPAGAGAKAGIMIRENLDENRPRPLDPTEPSQAFSRYLELAVRAPASVFGEPDSNHHIFQRATFGGFDTLELTVTNDAAPAFPNAWLRVERIGNEFKMYRGVDGATWQQIGGATFDPAMTNKVWVGLAFSAQNDDIPFATEFRKSFVAKFRDYELIPTEPEPGPLHIQNFADYAEITWEGPGTLQTAPTVIGEWADLPTAISPFRVNFTEPMRFYRLRN